jgi:tetratricopeptide (TPR) repeat protein
VARESEEKIRRFIDRGLARYGRGQFKEAVAEWEQALAWDAANSEARTLIDFVNRKLLADEEQGDPDRKNTDPVLPRYEDAGLLGDELGVYDAPTRIAPPGAIDGIDDDAPTGPHEPVRHPTLESPIPQLLAQITSPEWEQPPTEVEELLPRDEGAPEAPVFGEETRRLGSEPHNTDDSGRVPQTIDLPSQDQATEMRVLAGELVDRCRTMLEKGKLEAAVAAAESALRQGERAPPPGIAEVIEPARAIFERAFEAYVGALEQVPVMAISEGVLASQGFDHRVGFLLSLIDGVMTIEALLDIAGMPRFEAMRILALLLRSKTIRML